MPQLDVRLERTLVRELHWQAESAIELIDGLLAVDKPDARHLWPRAQAMLGSVAICSKILWPPRSGRSSARLEGHFPTRGEHLRSLLGVPSESRLHDRELRNSFEHIDERFEEWALDSTASEPLDAAVVEGVDVQINFTDPSTKNVFRFYDNRRLRFWDLDVDLSALRAELVDLHIAAEEHLAIAPPPAAPGTATVRF